MSTSLVCYPGGTKINRLDTAVPGTERKGRSAGTEGTVGIERRGRERSGWGWGDG